MFAVFFPMAGYSGHRLFQHHSIKVKGEMLARRPGTSIACGPVLGAGFLKMGAAFATTRRDGSGNHSTSKSEVIQRSENKTHHSPEQNR